MPRATRIALLAPDDPDFGRQGKEVQKAASALGVALAVVEVRGGDCEGALASMAKSGAKRTTPLVYHRIGERLLIIASTGGGPRNPAVRVELGDETWEGRAVVLSGADRDALFAAVVKATPTFGRYQERTQRTIPVVELLPANQ